MKVTIELKGVSELQRALKAKEKEFLAELGDALPEEGEALMTAANAVAPSETGEMIASSSVTTEVKRGSVQVAAAYLDEKAAAVHEGFHGGKDVDGTLPGEKWFEQTLNSFEPGFEQRIAARLKRVTGGGG